MMNRSINLPKESLDDWTKKFDEILNVSSIFSKLAALNKVVQLEEITKIGGLNPVDVQTIVAFLSQFKELEALRPLLGSHLKEIDKSRATLIGLVEQSSNDYLAKVIREDQEYRLMKFWPNLFNNYASQLLKAANDYEEARKTCSDVINALDNSTVFLGKWLSKNLLIRGTEKERKDSIALKEDWLRLLSDLRTHLGSVREFLARKSPMIPNPRRETKMEAFDRTNLSIKFSESKHPSECGEHFFPEVDKLIKGVERLCKDLKNVVRECNSDRDLSAVDTSGSLQTTTLFSNVTNEIEENNVIIEERCTDLRQKYLTTISEKKKRDPTRCVDEQALRALDYLGKLESNYDEIVNSRSKLMKVYRKMWKMFNSSNIYTKMVKVAGFLKEGRSDYTQLSGESLLPCFEILRNCSDTIFSHGSDLLMQCKEADESYSKMRQILERLIETINGDSEDLDFFFEDKQKAVIFYYEYLDQFRFEEQSYAKLKELVLKQPSSIFENIEAIIKYAKYFHTYFTEAKNNTRLD